MAVSCFLSDHDSIESLPFLKEKARTSAADLERQSARLHELIAAFESQQLTLTPSAFATQQAEIAQQTLIVANAEQAKDCAERELTNARNEYERRQAEELKMQRRQAIHAQLDQVGMGISEMQALLGRLPEQIARARAKHSALLAELATL
jgi:hypothetical protein